MIVMVLMPDGVQEDKAILIRATVAAALMNIYAAFYLFYQSW